MKRMNSLKTQFSLRKSLLENFHSTHDMYKLKHPLKININIDIISCGSLLSQY